MSSFKSCRSLLAFAACLTPAFVLAIPLADPGVREVGLSRRGNTRHLECGNAPNITAGYLVSAANISTPSGDDGPPKISTTNDTTGYFPYLWCGAGTTTYVFIDPIGKYGQNKGTGQPIFWTGLDGVYNATQNAMEANRRLNVNLPTGDGRIDEPAATATSRDIVLPVENIAGRSGISEIEVFVQNANHQHLTWGIYASALTIMKDFVVNYPLFADAMYFQICDGDFSTVANGYMGARFKGSEVCYLQGSATQNPAVTCAMPSDYPDS